MRDYLGVLADTTVSEEDFLDPEIHACAVDEHGWGHTGAVHMTISSICLGRRVRLTRRKMTPTSQEVPGVLEGEVIGTSHNLEGRILLGLELDTGEVVGVDVSNPNHWAWDVG